MKISSIISRIFDPILISPLILFFISWITPTSLSKNIFFLLLMLIIFVSSVVSFYILRKLDLIKDRDITNREERPLFFSIVLLSIVVFLLYIFFFDKQQAFIFLLKVLSPFFAFYLISFFYKVSGHGFINSLFFMVLFLFLIKINKFNFLWLGLMLISIFAIGWARVKLKKHTLLQVIIGSLLPWISFFMLR